MRAPTWILCALLGTACATTPPLNEQQVADTRASVRIAEQAGARDDAQAGPYLALARQQLHEADNAIALRDYSTASSWLRMAQANAELATSLARESSARAEAMEARRQADELKARLPETNAPAQEQQP
jgi:hypothetical protein